MSRMFWFSGLYKLCRQAEDPKELQISGGAFQSVGPFVFNELFWSNDLKFQPSTPVDISPAAGRGDWNRQDHFFSLFPKTVTSETDTFEDL